jgi:hypothetical protein
MVIHTCNPSTLEAEAGESGVQKPAWTIEQNPVSINK